MNETDLDITKKIKDIEFLRAEILQRFAELNKSMLLSDDENQNRTAFFSDILIYSYLLANKIGINFETLDKKIISQLKINILCDDKGLKDDFISLLSYLDD